MTQSSSAGIGKENPDEAATNIASELLQVETVWRDQDSISEEVVKLQERFNKEVVHWKMHNMFSLFRIQRMVYEKTQERCAHWGTTLDRASCCCLQTCHFDSRPSCTRPSALLRSPPP